MYTYVYIHVNIYACPPGVPERARHQTHARMPFCVGGHRGTLLVRNSPPPQDHHMTLDIVLL